jgi:cell division septation protein DedD
MLTLLGLGLLTLCGVCFVFGYAVGQHGAPVTPAAAVPTATAAMGTAQNSMAPSKPAPSQNSFQPRPAAEVPAAAAPDDNETKTADSERPARSVPASTQPAQSSGPALTKTQATPATVVQTALPGQSSSPQAAIISGTVVRPALPQANPQGATQSGTQPGTWMVQIAAVSHPEDADVLVSALRKHGYAVSVHRDPIDALIHVQVGPFATHNDAAAMRQKLLNDGYNAMVQP